MNRRKVAACTLGVMLPLMTVRAQGGAIHGTITVPNAGITNVVVYLVPENAPGAPAVAPLTATMDQRDLSFVPRVVAVTPGSKIVFSNSDRVMHNVFHPWQRSDGFDLGLWAPGESRDFTFAKEGAYVILCQVHPEMVGYIVVVASPYRAVSDDSGRFSIEGVAAGSYRLRTWHRRLEAHEERVTVPEGGSVRVELKLKYGSAVAPGAKP
ncbi:MAG: carboxypeptidase regulatory-like domain-containing protein [Gemmatimonadales bacterium]